MPWLVATSQTCPHCVRWKSEYERRLATLSAAEKDLMMKNVIVFDVENDRALATRLQVSSVPSVYNADTGRAMPLNAFTFLDKAFQIVLKHHPGQPTTGGGSSSSSSSSSKKYETWQVVLAVGVGVWVINKYL